MFPGWNLHFSSTSFPSEHTWHPDDIHQETKIPRWWTVILTSESPLGIRDCFIVTFSEWAVTLWSSFGYLWMRIWLSVNENVKRVIEASEIKQKTYLFFVKLGNYSSPLKFWNRLIMWALPLTTHPVRTTLLLIEFFLCKSLKLICPSLLKSDKMILDSLVIPI